VEKTRVAPIRHSTGNPVRLGGLDQSPPPRGRADALLARLGYPPVPT
jgi:hypothetical protein